MYRHFEKLGSRGAWVAQSAERLTLVFGSGHDLSQGRDSDARVRL